MESVYGLNFRHLRMLATMAEHGTLGSAARAAGISQPALTQALAKLENTVGVQLFERRPTGILPTSGGKRVLRRVDRAMDQFAKAMRRASEGPLGTAPEHYLTGSHVRALLGLAEGGSFTRGAGLAGVSVPAVHRSVRDLETMLNVVLVERRGRGVALAAAGTSLARGFMLGVSEIAAALDEGADGGRRLAIGAMALSRSLLLPATLAKLLRDRPDAKVDVVEGSYLELVEQLRSGRIDVIVGALREHPARDLNQQPLFADRLTIIGRAEHPLATGIAGFEDLSTFPWIVARRASGLLERWQSMFDHAGMPRPQAPIQCGSVALIRGVLTRTDFLTLLSPDQVSAEIDAGTLVCIRSTVPDTERIIGTITRRDWYPTQLQDRFMDALIANIPTASA